MKKVKALLGIFLATALLASCASTASSSAASQSSAADSTGSAPVETVKVDELKIAYSPSADAQAILDTTEPLKQLLIDQLATRGFEVGKVDITVGTSFEAIGESLASGSVDVGIGGGSIYVTYEDDVDLLLTATRDDFNVDSANPMDWNKEIPTRVPGKMTTGYRGLIYAGPSAYGKELAAKVENGEELTFEDLDKATWAVGNTTSNAGYLFPSQWLKTKYGKTLADLSNIVPGTNYPTMFTQAASEQIDVFVVFADGRDTYKDAWTSEMGRSESIYDEVKVIGVTDMIMNDVTMGSKISDTMNLPGFKEAFEQSMIDIAKTPEGQKAISVLGHTGYIIGNDADYDVLREVLADVKSMS